MMNRRKSAGLLLCFWLFAAVAGSATAVAAPPEFARWRLNQRRMPNPPTFRRVMPNRGQVQEVAPRTRLPRGRNYYQGRYFGNYNNRYYGPQYGYF